MDFCVEDGDGNFIDVEMQKRNEGNIPKRKTYITIPRKFLLSAVFHIVKKVYQSFIYLIIIPTLGIQNNLLAFIRIAETFAPEYDIEQIYRELKSTRMTSES
mgnify:CR=1 FL=1